MSSVKTFLVSIVLIYSIFPAWGSELSLFFTNTRLPSLTHSHAAVYDGDDSIYIIGGQNGTTVQTSVYKYSLGSGTVQTIGSFEPRELGGVFMNENDIFFMGGRSTPDDSGAQSGVLRYSIVDNSYNPVLDLPDSIYAMTLGWDQSTHLAYTFGGWGSSGAIDSVLRYNPTTNQVFQVASLPEGRYRAAAVMTRNGIGYVFGGFTPDEAAFNSTSDILQFNPVQGSVTELDTSLPYSPSDPCAVDTGDRAFVFGGPEGSLIEFDYLSQEAEEIEVELWPVDLQLTGCVYVPKLDRIYVIGGLGTYGGEVTRARDEIFYIDLGATGGPIDCSDGGLRVQADPFCCTAFYVCSAGVPTKITCDEGQQFNPATLQCENESLVRCKNNYYG